MDQPDLVVGQFPRGTSFEDVRSYQGYKMCMWFMSLVLLAASHKHYPRYDSGTHWNEEQLQCNLIMCSLLWGCVGDTQPGMFGNSFKAATNMP